MEPNKLPEALLRVRERELLVLPNRFQTVHRAWLRPGGIVDAREPAIRELLEGQEWKLELAPEGAEPSPLPSPVAGHCASRARATRPSAPPAAAAVAAASEGGLTAEIQRPDPPKKAKEKAPAA